MPAQVVVVKRTRRSVFAILRNAPAWFRAVFVGLRASGRNRSRFDLGPKGPFEEAAGMAWARPAQPRSPRLVEKADLEGCRACTRCVVECPSDALFFEFGVDPTSSEVLRFDLDPGRCIGCGECVRICPMRLLESAPWPDRVGEGPAPGRRRLLPEADLGSMV